MAVVLGMTLLFKDMFLKSLPTGQWMPSKLDCVSKCYRQVNCSSLFYNIHNQVCQFVPDVYSDAQMEASDGMLYFIWTHVACGNGYTWYAPLKLCYKLNETRVTRTIAATTCEIENGRLIRVDNADKNEFLTTLAENKGRHIWIDGSDLQQEGTWVWSDGSTLNQHFWAPNQPAGTTTENCLVIFSRGGVNRRWHDIRCNTQNAFICQQPMTENRNC